MDHHPCYWPVLDPGMILKMGSTSCERQDQGDTQELISTCDGGPDQNHGDTSGGADVDHTYQPSRTDTLWKNADVKW